MMHSGLNHAPLIFTCNPYSALKSVIYLFIITSFGERNVS